MGKFFSQKHCVYLDQFAVSHCADPAASPEWRQVRALLEAGVQQQRLVIPYSVEHLLESSLRDAARADGQDEFLFDLSSGLTLATEGDITARLLLNLARRRSPGLSSFCYYLPERGFARPGGFQQAGQLKQQFNALLESGLGGINLVRKATAQTPAAPPQLQQVTVQLKLHYYQRELVAQLKKLARYGVLELKQTIFPMGSIPMWSSALLTKLVREHHLTRREAGRLKAALEQSKLEHTVPTLFIRANLEAAMAFRHRRETPNDAVDIQRLSAALPVADIVVTDKAKCSDIKLLQLDTHYQAAVYSGSPADLALFIQHLTSLLTEVRAGNY